jgi:hypothetical protein
MINSNMILPLTIGVAYDHLATNFIRMKHLEVKKQVLALSFFPGCFMQLNLF